MRDFRLISETLATIYTHIPDHVEEKNILDVGDLFRSGEMASAVVVSAEQTKQKPKTINKNCSKCGENAPS